MYVELYVVQPRNIETVHITFCIYRFKQTDMNLTKQRHQWDLTSFVYSS